VPRLAIVISALGSSETLERTLLSVLENKPRDCEVIVALNQPYADPYALQGEVQFIKAAPRTSPVERINRALATTRAPFVHLLASGCEVSEGWADAALTRFGDRQVGSVAPVVLAADDRETIFAAGVGYRRGGKRYLVGQGQASLTAAAQESIVGACGFAAFYRKAALDFVGGMSGQLGLRQADVDLALVLKQAGFAVALEMKSRVFGTAEADPGGSAFEQALYDERLFWRNVESAGAVQSWAAHAVLVAAEMACSLGRPRMLAQFTARFLAAASPYRRHRRALAELGRRSVRSKSVLERLRIDRSHDAPAPAERTATRAAAR
jgi:GT2 family glycosyltransferase